VDACLVIVAPQAELLRASGVFGDKIELADASDAQARLLPRWGDEREMTAATHRAGEMTSPLPRSSSFAHPT
jgi:hypothetical protein